MQRRVAMLALLRTCKRTCLRAVTLATLCVPALVVAAENNPGEYQFRWRTSEGKTRILWVGGGHWHDTLETTAILRRGLESTGNYHVTYSEDTSVLTRLDLYDVVVLNGMLDSLEAEEEESLLDAIHGGTPLLVLHAASASFRKPPPAKDVDPPVDHPRFYEMLGGYVERHPPFGPIQIRVKAIDHPIIDGVDDFVIEDELFLFRSPAAENHVLLEADFEGEPRPLAWTRRWGNGRVFHLALGHNAKAASHPAFQRLVTQGLDWLTGRRTTEEKNGH